MPWYLNHALHGNQPWDVQVEAGRRSSGFKRFGYFMEQGLGKTATILNDYVHYDDVDLMLVIAPQSFKADWAIAPAEWGVGHIPGEYWPKHPIPFKAEQGVYAVNYEAISRSSAQKDFARLMKERRVMLVIDESAAIKNPTSGFSRSIFELSKDAVMVREANGTPIVQNVMDLYMQLKVLGEMDGWNPFAFRNKFATMGGFMGKQIVAVDADGNPAIKNSEILYKILDRCSFRALKKDWRDLPPQLDVPVHLELTSKQVLHYREMMEEFVTLVNDDVAVTATLVLTQMLRLQQISSGLASDGERTTWIEETSKLPKVRAIFDLFNAGTGKMIVVHVFRASGDLLVEAFEKAGLRPAILRGQMKPEDILEEKRRFNDDPDCRVMVAQESAAFRGHTLIGGKGSDRCTRMTFYEASASFYEYAQIRDRIHRGDQDQTCNYYQLISSPIEQFQFDLLTGKRDMASAVDDVIKSVKGGKWRI